MRTFQQLIVLAMHYNDHYFAIVIGFMHFLYCGVVIIYLEKEKN